MFLIFVGILNAEIQSRFAQCVIRNMNSLDVDHHQSICNYVCFHDRFAYYNDCTRCGIYTSTFVFSMGAYATLEGYEINPVFSYLTEKDDIIEEPLKFKRYSYHSTYEYKKAITNRFKQARNILGLGKHEYPHSYIIGELDFPDMDHVVAVQRSGDEYFIWQSYIEAYHLGQFINKKTIGCKEIGGHRALSRTEFKIWFDKVEKLALAPLYRTLGMDSLTDEDLNNLHMEVFCTSKEDGLFLYNHMNPNLAKFHFALLNEDGCDSVMYKYDRVLNPKIESEMSDISDDSFYSASSIMKRVNKPPIRFDDQYDYYYPSKGSIKKTAMS